MTSTSRAWVSWLGAVAGCELVGILGSIFTVEAIPTWYASLTKPSFQPPNWLFGPVWTVLYALMGTAVWLAYRRATTASIRRQIVSVFLVQLVLNGIWTPIFFGLHALGAALAVISALVVAIVATMVVFARTSTRAAVLLAPYLAWVMFATILNASLWRLNG